MVERTCDWEVGGMVRGGGLDRLICYEAIQIM